MPTTYNFDYTGGEQTFEIPANVYKIKVQAYGAGGADGVVDTDSYDKSTADGDSGGYAEGILSVNPGEMLYAYVGESAPTPSLNNSATRGGWPNGGSGGYGIGGGVEESYGGGGGGSTDVRLNGNTTSDIQILAGGGGGGGAAVADEGDAESNSNNGGDGGGVGEDGGGGFDYDGKGGESGSFQGGDANGFTRDDEHNSAGGGGGGGGLNGGGGGAGVEYYSEFSEDDIYGGGGGGGDGYVSPATSTTMSNSGKLGDGKLVITTYERPAVPSILDWDVDKYGNVTVSWHDTNGVEQGYELYNSSTSGVATSDSLVANNGANDTTYSESFNSNVEEYFAVRATNGPAKSGLSEEIAVKVGMVKCYNGSSWVAKTVFHGSDLEPASEVTGY